MLLSGSRRLSDLACLFVAGLERHVGRLRLERPAADVQMMVDGDLTLLARLMGGGRAGERWRCWQNRHCLVVPRNWSRLSGFRDAVLDCPLPVALRASGGSAVVHGPHVLNVSLAWLALESDGAGIQQGYARLTAPLVAALADMGVSAGLSRVTGAHCDGHCNLVHEGRKLAGTAGLIRPAGPQRGLLLHASLSLGPRDGDLDIIMDFERRLGRAPDYRADAHATLAGALRAAALPDPATL
ncbi:hypothetical protein [Niveispirillum sp.]|uniref:lipoate--protein ligase family protein n=1 Tax=Niveispirillum sp. TaxID=1917217 RepID=UPI001B7151B4|nr:hypothetical protein [Niveispirillum sp.]MBP7334851.1 hypothetical protein [Niveispirillum sp.]